MSEGTAKKEKLFVIKIGGNVIDDDQQLSKFLKTFASINERKILVHGGGKIATTLGDKLGIKSNYINGRRITDDETISLVTMVYGGLINKKIVAALQSFKCNSFGVTGADGNLIPAMKRPVKEIDFGWVGDVVENNKHANWNLFLDNGLTPVVAPLSHDGMGNMLNINADTIASAIGVQLSEKYEVCLIYCFEKNGVLKNIEDENSVIKNIDRKNFEELVKENIVNEGMIPKIENALNAIDKGVKKIVIGKAEDLIANTSENTKGTTFYK
ncbi:MAG: acetylglutamate kinase [Ginsengibacter sp.]